MGVENLRRQDVDRHRGTVARHHVGSRVAHGPDATARPGHSRADGVDRPHIR
ncbi:hypothetical protein ACU686_41180 [Yinghuangia aomiensis]